MQMEWKSTNYCAHIQHSPNVLLDMIVNDFVMLSHRKEQFDVENNFN